jgi:hypothetical protein
MTAVLEAEAAELTRQQHIVAAMETHQIDHPHKETMVVQVFLVRQTEAVLAVGVVLVELEALGKQVRHFKAALVVLERNTQLLDHRSTTLAVAAVQIMEPAR